MKFSFALFPVVAQLSPCARPAGGEHEIIVGHERGHDANRTGREEDSYCTYEKAQTCIKGRCKAPGHDIFDYIWTYEGVLTNYHGDCKIGCCDKHAKVEDDKCKCTPYGDAYDGFSWGEKVVGANSPDNCCGRKANGKGATEGGKCGCTATGQKGAWGTDPKRDCCSLAHQDGVCVKRNCTKKFASGECCRVVGDRSAKTEPSCPCFHGGDRPHPDDNVGYDNCCAGHANEANNACGCIADGSTKLPVGADERDCCSGDTTADKKNCVAAKCFAVGATVKGPGDHCCSGKQSKTKTCKCIPSGEDIPKGGTPADCCSNRADADGKKCAYFLKGETILNGTKAGEVCLSGSANDFNECRCVGKGKKTKDKTQCCSGTFGADGACGCLAVKSVLADGARHADCCTGTASPDGVCRCAGAGAPIPEGKVSNCCAGADTSGKFCSCYVAGNNEQPIVAAVSDLCCGGSYHYHHKDSVCTCIPTGFAVGSWVPATACCGKQKAGDVCSASSK